VGLSELALAFLPQGLLVGGIDKQQATSRFNFEVDRLICVELYWHNY
jgi:hypothetical protein